MIEVSAKEILQLNTEELRAVRVKAFKDFGKKVLGNEEGRDAFLKFTYLLMLVQDMRAWSKLAEPGIAAHIDPEDPLWSKEIESARELDRLSIEGHNDVTGEFYRLGGTEAMQQAIDVLNRIK